ncbi:HAD family hydrolase [Thiosocius teredinicola]|uniref:HAD family hydrolase n=1 Tax=Thiosocius teredinicola TaxID=1973002 RepID=UPI0009911862
MSGVASVAVSDQGDTDVISARANTRALIEEKKVLLLDMNGTFMFGEDRFGPDEDYAAHYAALGGELPARQVNAAIRAIYAYLDVRYPDEQYRHCFPSVETAIRDLFGQQLVADEVHRIVNTFAFHELGYIPAAYAQALHSLNRRFTLAAIVDIWAPKPLWLREFERAGVVDLFAACSFSSDHGVVKPSPQPFLHLLRELGTQPDQALVVGDSARRDLGGAKAAGIDCVLVGRAEHADAVASFANLLQLCDFVEAPA